MNADERRLKLDKITERIIGCVYKVSNILGSGFLEKVYENALTLELRNNGLKVEPQHGIQVRYDGVVVGEFAADLLVEDKIIIELKATKALDDIHTAQCLNYLKATDLLVCLLINFGKPKAEIRRIVNNF
jgi:GxxExxY protein